MTEPLIKLPSVELRELKEAIEQNKEELSMAKKELSLKNAYIKELEQKPAELQS